VARAGPPDADRELATLGAELSSAVVAAVPGWVVGCVDRLLPADAADRAGVMARAEEAGRRAAKDVGEHLASLLGADVDRQSPTPLEVVRRVVTYPTEVLLEAGVAPVGRDAFARRRFPADVYGLAPPSLAALDPALAETALAWGAAKALAHRRRHVPSPEVPRRSHP